LTVDESPGTVAVVGSRTIPESRLEARIAAMRRGPLGRRLPPADHPLPPDLRRLVARDLVTEELLLLEAEAAGIATEGARDADGAPRLEALARVVRLLLERVTATVAVADEEVRAYYDRNPDRYRIAEGRLARQIVVPDEETARVLRNLLRRGADFDELAQDGSIDATRPNSGRDLGVVRHGELTGPLEDALFAAPVGSIVGPIATEHGWHVARVDGRVPEGRRAYEDVRDAIRAELLEAARQRAFGEWVEERRSALGVMAPGFGHPADPLDGIPSHRH
jgi:hypothetical protein